MDHPCPTFSRIFWQLWHSPTFTTWGNYLTQSLRLFAVTPLILTKFDAVEITAWLLFGSLMVFGNMLNQRIALTFSRMIAFGMGGATDLSPIRDNKIKRGQGDPNWPLIERTYGTIGGLNFLLSFITSLIAAGLGFFGLQKLVAAHDQGQHIWIAFAIFLLSQTIIFIFRKYHVALKGMNHVALLNRWSIVFSLLSITCGFIALTLGANIWQLALVMQSVLLLDLLRMRFLFRHVEGGKCKHFRGFRLDREIIGWAKEPLVKGLFIGIANLGVIQLGSVVYARYGEAEAVAAYLLALRLIQTANKFSNAPFSSHLPKMSRLISEGKIQKLRKLVESRIRLAQGLLFGSALAIGVVAVPLLELIGSNISFLRFDHYIVLISAVVLQRYIILTLSVSSIGNHVVCFKEEIAAALLSIALIAFLVPAVGFFGLILAVFLPQIILLNIKPLKIAANRLETSLSGCFWRTGGGTSVILSIIMFAIASYAAL